LPELARFGAGPYELHWLGQLKRSENPQSPTGVDMSAHFLGGPTADFPHVDVDLPLAYLPNLRLGMLWRNGSSMVPPKGFTTMVRVDMARFDADQHATVDPMDVIPPSVLRLARVPMRSWVRPVPLVDGSELLVPTFELLRAMYFIHPHFIPAFVGGAFDDPDRVSPKLMPWHPKGTFRESSDVVRISFPRRTGLDWAKLLAAILFDPLAMRGLRQIFGRMHKGKLSGKPFIFPPLVPPLEGQADWRIRYLHVPPYRGAAARRLVLSIDDTDHPLPFKNIRPITPDNYSTRTRDQAPHLYTHRSTRIELPNDGALDLYPTASDTRLQKVDLAGFSVGSSALDVGVLHEQKDSQLYRSPGGAHGDAVPVDGISMDESGLPAEGRPGLAASSSGAKAAVDRNSEEADVIDMRQVFADVGDQLRASSSMAGWEIGAYGQSGTVRVYHERRKVHRTFMVLHLRHVFRHVYVLEAEKLTSYDTFPVLTCQRPQGQEISAREFAEWLGGFPYTEHRRWQDPTADGLMLLAVPTKHQPRRIGATSEEVHRRFVDRLAHHVEEFVRDPLWRHRTVAQRLGIPMA